MLENLYPLSIGNEKLLCCIPDKNTAFPHGFLVSISHPQTSESHTASPTFTLRLFVPDIDLLYSTLKKQGLTSLTPPENKPGGTRTFSCLSNRNVAIIFSQVPEKAS